MNVDLYSGLVFLHVASAFAFAAGHGVSVFVAFQLRREREPARMAALLDLSAASLAMAIVGLLVLLATGIATGIMGGFFGRGWIWLSLLLLIAIGGLMTPLGKNHFGRIREVVGPQPGASDANGPDAVVSTADQLPALLATRRPELLAGIGGAGFLVILWLMMFKPF
ncbi:MAG TPA: hypothetical protein VM344_07795 [Vitreimonas sp.]|nr:hypothetical protein [Vitreimonas sp.]